CGCLVLPQSRCRVQGGSDDRAVSSAPADIPREDVTDIRFGGHRICGKKLYECHQDSRRAEATLEPMIIVEGRLQWMKLTIRACKRLNCGDRVFMCLDGQHQAAPGAVTVDQHRTRTTHAVLASEMGAG